MKRVDLLGKRLQLPTNDDSLDVEMRLEDDSSIVSHQGSIVSWLAH